MGFGFMWRLKEHTSDFDHEQDLQILFFFFWSSIKKNLNQVSATLILAFVFSVVFLQSARG